MTTYTFFFNGEYKTVEADTEETRGSLGPRARRQARRRSLSRQDCGGRAEPSDASKGKDYVRVGTLWTSRSVRVRAPPVFS